MYEDILRLRYVFYWAFPYFAALIYSGKSLDITLFLAAVFLTISVNVHNDLCEGKLKGYASRHLKFLTVFSFILGISLFPHYLLFLGALGAFLYNWRFRTVPIISLIAAMMAPLVMLLIIEIYDIIPILAVIFYGLSVHGYHQLIDGESLCKVRYGYLLIMILSILTAISLVIIVYPINTILTFVAPVGFLYLAASSYYFRNKFRFGKPLHKKERDFWILLGNMAMIFVIIWYLILLG